MTDFRDPARGNLVACDSPGCSSIISQRRAREWFGILHRKCKACGGAPQGSVILTATLPSCESCHGKTATTHPHLFDRGVNLDACSPECAARIHEKINGIVGADVIEFLSFEEQANHDMRKRHAC